MSFLEMLDYLNDKLINEGIEPVVFDHDCREGICGMCSLFINGEAHGPGRKVTTCQLHMREFKSGDTIYIEPFRAKAFPIIKDLMVDVQLLTAFNVQVGTLVSTHLETPLTQMRFPYLRKMQIGPLMRQLVLVVVLVWLRVKTLLQCYLLRLKSVSSLCCHKGSLRRKSVC